MIRSQMGNEPHFSILVNSSDGFEDCWNPFFYLFERFWPSCDVPIFLNTELKQPVFHGLNVVPTQVGLGQEQKGRLTWSECLGSALKQIKTPLVLYMQEDYFLSHEVNDSLVKEMAALMISRPEIKHLGLTPVGSGGSFTSTDNPRLWRIARNAPYRVSTQAGLWRVDTLQSLLRPWENGWMFEIFGTRRARRDDELFFTLNRDQFDWEKSPVIRYIYTGIVKGRWHYDVPDHFLSHGIIVDFSKRGFYSEKAAVLRRMDLLKKIASHPVSSLKSLLA